MSQVSSPDTAQAMEPFARALQAFLAGDVAAECLMCRDDGLTVPLPARHFFRAESELSPIERRALEACRGHVLDVGAGAGEHSLVLQSRGVPVTALDISPAAVEIMRRRGVRDVRQGAFLDWSDGSFDTLLLLGHGVGMAGDLAGLDRLLAHARELLLPGGALLADSTDVTRTENPSHLAYLEANRRAGRYVGEVRMRFEHAGEVGPHCKWLHVDPVTLRVAAANAGFTFELLLQEDSGEYLARLAV